MAIHPTALVAETARVHPEAHIGAGTVIGEFSLIEQDVWIGEECRLEPYVYVKRWTTMGDRNEISAGTALGTDPLDRNFKRTDRSYLRIGNANIIREHYTVSRGTKPETTTTIGDDNYIMTSGHIAHNCKIGNSVVIASCALIAGYSEVEDQAFLSGGVLVHQFSKIGKLALISGNARVNLDVPPFIIAAGVDAEPMGLNAVGLKRAGFSGPEIATLKLAYQKLYRSGLLLAEALKQIEIELDGEHVRYMVEFIRRSTRGICRENRNRLKQSSAD